MINLKKTFTALLVTACIAITGCASKSPYEIKYDEGKSLALNIVNSAGINQYSNIKDTKVPVGVKKHLASTTEYGAFNAALRYNFPADGVSGLAAGGLGVLEMLTAAKEHSEQTHLLAWIPVAEVASAEEAQELLFNESVKAINRTIENLGVEVKFTNITRKNNVIVYAANFEGIFGCDNAREDTGCFIVVRIAKPIKTRLIMPEQITGTSTEVYTFRPNGLRDLNSTLFVKRHNANVKHPELLKEVSDQMASMPIATAVYVPPMSRRETIGTKYPYVLKNGKYELFITE